MSNAPSSENVASSAKQEVHNILLCRQRRTEPRPQITCTENIVNFGFVIFEIMQANRQTYRLADRTALLA